MSGGGVVGGGETGRGKLTKFRGEAVLRWLLQGYIISVSRLFDHFLLRSFIRSKDKDAEIAATRETIADELIFIRGVLISWCRTIESN